MTVCMLNQHRDLPKLNSQASNFLSIAQTQKSNDPEFAKELQKSKQNAQTLLNNIDAFQNQTAVEVRVLRDEVELHLDALQRPNLSQEEKIQIQSRLDVSAHKIAGLRNKVMGVQEYQSREISRGIQASYRSESLDQEALGIRYTDGYDHILNKELLEQNRKEKSKLFHKRIDYSLETAEKGIQIIEYGREVGRIYDQTVTEKLKTSAALDKLANASGLSGEGNFQIEKGYEVISELESAEVLLKQ